MRRIPLLLSLSVVPSVLLAQSTVARETSLLTAPGGRALATLQPGAPVQSSATARGGATQVTIQGWIHRSSLGGRRDAFPLSVVRDRAPLRSAASTSGRVLARLERGMGLRQLSRRGEWVQVSRTAWISTRALASPTRSDDPRPTALAQRREPAQRARAGQPPRQPAAQSAPADTTAPAVAVTEREVSEDLTTSRQLPILSAPGERPIGSVEPGARLQAVARDRGWVRVRLEGWVRDSALVPADTAGATLSAADIRADPEAARGRTVRWEVQKISYQLADALRRDLAQNEPYLLARGPGNENALLYLALPPSLAERAQAVPPLSTVLITARVRTGRSEPAGIPILDVVSLTQR